MEFRPATLLLPLLLTACADSGPEADVTAIRSCYDAYFSALRDGRGNDAADLVDSNTLAHYGRILELARTADSATVSSLDAMDKLSVLAMRMNHSAEDLRTMDAKGAKARSISDGLMGNEQPEGLSLGTVEVDGDKATAPLKVHGFPTPAKFTFRKEDGGWRIDITSMFDLSRMGMQQMVSGSGKDGNVYLVELLEESSGKPVPANIWNPIR